MNKYFILLFSPLVWGQGSQEAVEENMTVVYKADDFHDRGAAMAPTLVYKKEFFLRFEPNSVGDILKRLPGISGSADAGEFETPQLRGLPPGYTRITINGRNLPGAANDHTLVIDRIPAHLVERVEIIRSAGADHDAAGIGGTINIVLKQAQAHRSSDLLLGLRSFDNDNKQTGQASAGHSGTKGAMSYQFTASYHNRHNPKRQFTNITEEGELIKKDEHNTLDADEFGLVGGLKFDLTGGATLGLGLTLLSSDADEREDATFAADGELEEHSFDFGSVTKENLNVDVDYSYPFSSLGRLDINLTHRRFEIDQHLDIGLFDEDGHGEVEEIETDQTEDETTSLSVSMNLMHLARQQLKIGLDVSTRTRHARARLFEIEDGEQEELAYGGVFRIEQERLDAYIMDTWDFTEHHGLQVGLRLESTSTQMPDAGIKRNTTELFPSLHYRYQPNSANRFNLSLSRTGKRSDFYDLQPFERRDQPFEDLVTLGNPDLKPEYALGLDAGFQHTLQDGIGVAGLNLFYREISDLVEVLQIQEDVFMVGNSGDGKIWGFELDLGLPLTGLGIPNLSVFANAAWQDSEIIDPLSGKSRPFNLQSSGVVNLSFLHALPNYGISYGLTWLSQGKAREALLIEQSTLEYPDNLDLLFEARLFENWSLRFTARNLLDASKDVLLREYEDLDGGGSLFDEREYSGRSYQLILRGQLGN